MAELHRISRYDPEHLPREIELIEAFRQGHPNLPQVACFDTAFHRSMPRVATLLPIPRRFDAKGVQRHGFHGLSYSYLMEELVRLGDPAATKGRVILAHVGNLAARQRHKVLKNLFRIPPHVAPGAVGDLPGYLLEQGGWEHLNLPAIATQEQRIYLKDGHWARRRKGRILHEERIDQAELDRIKQELGTLTFQAQYQQDPAPPEGNLVKVDWFERYDETPSVGDFEVIVQSWDTAIETGDSNDYSVCQTWGINGDRLFLLHVDRHRLPYPALRKRMLTLQHRYGTKLVIVEDAGNGKSPRQDIQSQGVNWLKGLKPAQDKITRLAQQSAKIEAGMVFLPTKAPWLAAFEKELTTFPNDKHDDQVDALSQFLRALDFRPVEILPLKLYHSDRWLWAKSKEDQIALSQ